MNITISNSSGQPIYSQISSQIKSAIISEVLKEDEMLPSIRLLAKELRISVITTKRAYEELERDGFIYSVPGKGSFVAQKNVAIIREEQLKKIEELLRAASDLAASCNISLDELHEMLSLNFKED